MSPPIPKLIAVVAVGTSSDRLDRHHRRAVTRTGGDGGLCYGPVVIPSPLIINYFPPLLQFSFKSQILSFSAMRLLFFRVSPAALSLSFPTASFRRSSPMPPCRAAWGARIHRGATSLRCPPSPAVPPLPSLPRLPAERRVARGSAAAPPPSPAHPRRRSLPPLSATLPRRVAWGARIRYDTGQLPERDDGACGSAAAQGKWREGPWSLPSPLGAGKRRGAAASGGRAAAPPLPMVSGTTSKEAAR